MGVLILIIALRSPLVNKNQNRYELVEDSWVLGMTFGNLFAIENKFEKSLFFIEKNENIFL